MRSVTIISDSVLDLTRMAQSYETLGQIHLSPDIRLVVEGAWGWFAFNIGEPLMSDFEEAELAFVKSMIPRPCFSQLEFSDKPAADIAIGRLVGESSFLVDNDHGLITTLDEIQKRIRDGAEWQATST